MNLIEKNYSKRLELASSFLPDELRNPFVLSLLQRALEEDLSADSPFSSLGYAPATHDITSKATIPEALNLTGHIRAKARGVVAGLPLVASVFALIDPEVHVHGHLPDGEHVEKGQLFAEVDGPGISLLAGERTALNILGRLSGIASLTRQFVDAVQGTKAVILDTRKTAPGLRLLDKYAVRMGGGQNHRTGLFDMILIKDNHISGAGGIPAAVERARELYENRYPIEVEVKDLSELEEAIKLSVDRIMLDNMDLETMRIAVNTARGRVQLEASGNINLANVRQVAETGVDFISSGSLTHSAPTLDISMKIG